MLDFKDVRLLVCVPDSEQLDLVESFVQAHNNPSLATFDDVRALRGELPRMPADMLMLQIDGQAQDVHQLVHHLRHSEQDAATFAVVVAMIRSPDAESVRAVVNGGVDDIVLTPCSADQFHERLEGILKRRKPWVVTTDYVGPDRRKAARSEGVQIPLIDAPNPLRVQILKDRSPADYQREARATLAVINEQKIDRHGYQMVWLLDRLAAPSSDHGTLETCQHMNRLVTVSHDLKLRIGKSARDWLLGEAEDLHNRALRLMEAMPHPPKGDLHGLKRAANLFNERLVDPLPKAS